MVEAIDDPYKILALNLVATLSDGELYRIMHETKAIRRRITREVNDADFYGDFLDCIMTELVKSNKARMVNKYLVDAANFFYSHLDVPRLRREIIGYCIKLNRPIKDGFTKSESH